MVEHGFTPEHAQIVNEAGLALMLYGMAFRREIREQVRQRQKGICDCCGEKDFLQTHHIKPESLGGTSRRIDNAAGLCQSCHKEIDKETFAGRAYPQVHTDERYYPQGNGLK